MTVLTVVSSDAESDGSSAAAADRHLNRDIQPRETHGSIHSVQHHHHSQGHVHKVIRRFGSLAGTSVRVMISNRIVNERMNKGRQLVTPAPEGSVTCFLCSDLHFERSATFHKYVVRSALTHVKTFDLVVTTLAISCHLPHLVPNLLLNSSCARAAPGVFCPSSP